MRKIFILTLCALLFVPALSFGAAKGRGAYCLTGGTTGCIDAIDGDVLSNGDKLTAWVSGVRYDYNLNGSSSCTEGSTIAGITPIKPDNNPGTKCWELQKIRGIDFQGTTGGAINEFSTDGTMAGNSDTAVPTEQALVEYSMLMGAGLSTRSLITYKDADEIYLYPGVYHHKGTTEQFLYWDATLTFKLGSGGSNPASDDPGAGEYHYIYLDDSAIVTAGTNVITASEILNDTTGPSWSDANHGWYNGDDICIGCVVTQGGSADLRIFYVVGDLVKFDDQIESRTLADLDDTWTDVALVRPSFCNLVLVTFYGYNNFVGPGANITALYRKNGSSGIGHYVYALVSATNTHPMNTMPVVTDSNGKIEVKHSGAGDQQMAVYTDGWYYPIGM